MLSVYTRAQIAIAVLHDLSSSKVLQPVKFLLQNEEWKDLLNKLEKVKLIRLLPNKETRILFSYEFSRPLLQISLLNVLQTINIATYRYTSVSRNYHTLVWPEGFDLVQRLYDHAHAGQRSYEQPYLQLEAPYC